MTLRFCELAAKSGYLVKAFQGAKPNHFMSLSNQQQVQILEDFRRYLQVAEMMEARNELLDSEQKFLWLTIKEMGLRPTSDIFSKLDRDDVVEIYSASTYVQVFRNVKFFIYCSYTLDDILCRPYWALFKRDEEVSRAIAEKIHAVMYQPIPQTVAYDMPPHYLTEIDSPLRFYCKVTSKYISPLLNRENEIVAVVNVSCGKVCEVFRKET